MSSSKSIYETVEGSHEYIIEGYSLAKGMGVGKFMTSAKFTVAGYDWVINFFPAGHDLANQEYVSVFLAFKSPGEVRALLGFKILDQSGKGNHKIRNSPSPSTFSTEGNGRGFHHMKRSELETLGYVKNDSLTIHCTVRVVKDRVEEGKHYVIPVPPSDMIHKLKGLLENEIGTDITIHVGKECFRAHKLILAAHSPFFEAQFFGLMGNPDMKTLVIEEIDPFAFKAILLFLYSDELPEALELSDSGSLCTTITIMQHLLVAADRFGLPRLKLMCEAKLCEEMTADTVATTLVLADQCKCLQLKPACLNFAAKLENLGEVMKSDGYAHLEKTCPSLLADVLKTSVVVNTK